MAEIEFLKDTGAQFCRRSKGPILEATRKFYEQDCQTKNLCSMSEFQGQEWWHGKGIATLRSNAKIARDLVPFLMLKIR